MAWDPLVGWRPSMARITSPSSNFKAPSGGERTTSTPFSVPKYVPSLGVRVASSMLASGPCTMKKGFKGGIAGKSGKPPSNAMKPGPGRAVTVKSRGLPSRSTRTFSLLSGFTSRMILTT